MTGYADRERAVDVIYTDYSKTCNTLSHIKHYCLDRWKVRWVKSVWMAGLGEQWLVGWTVQRLIARAGSRASGLFYFPLYL